MFRTELDLFENLRVRLEPDERAVRLGSFALILLLELALLEKGLDELAFAKAAHQELFRERIDGLGAHPVQPHAELKYVVIIFRAGVNLRHALDHFSQRNPAPKITHRHRFVGDSDLDLLAG